MIEESSCKAANEDWGEQLWSLKHCRGSSCVQCILLQQNRVFNRFSQIRSQYRRQRQRNPNLPSQIIAQSSTPAGMREFFNAKTRDRPAIQRASHIKARFPSDRRATGANAEANPT